MKKSKIFTMLMICMGILFFMGTGFSSKASSPVEKDEIISNGEYKVCTSVRLPGNVFMDGPCSTACGYSAAKQCAFDIARGLYPEAVSISVRTSTKLAPRCL